MTVDLEFRQNQLLLNPRLPEVQRLQFQEAWSRLVEPKFEGHVGIATSGSSGTSFGKLIILSKEALRVSAASVNERFHSGPDDIWFKSLPDFHVGGLGILVRAKLSGAKIFRDTSLKWDVTGFLSQVEKSGATLISLVPTQVFDLVQAGLRAPASVRAVIVGGGRFENSLRERACDLGWPCLASYGMTETCSQIATALSPQDPRLVLLPHAIAKTEDDGKLAIKSGALLSAQVVFSESGASLIDPKVNDWFVSEDKGRVEGDSLIIEGRATDFVKIGGEGVLVSKLEELLEQLKLETSFSGDAVILAAHDDRLGATIVMMVNSSSKADANVLMAEFNKRVLPFERIREIRIVPEIPRSPLGKLLRGAALQLVGLKALAHD